MRIFGKALFIALELSSYLALVICLFMIFSLVVFGQIVFVTDGIIAISVSVVFGLFGVALGLRRIHHTKTMRLKSKGRIDEVEKLRFFILRSAKYIIIAAVFIIGLVFISMR